MPARELLGAEGADPSAACQADVEAQQREALTAAPYACAEAPQEAEPHRFGGGLGTCCCGAGWLDSKEWLEGRILPSPLRVGVSGTLAFASVAGGLWSVGELDDVLSMIFHVIAAWLLVGSFAAMILSLLLWCGGHHLEMWLKLLAEQCAALRTYPKEIPRNISGEVVAEVKAVEKRLVNSVELLARKLPESISRAMAEHVPHLHVPKNAPHMTRCFSCRKSSATT